jgi:hypothetical protein
MRKLKHLMAISVVLASVHAESKEWCPSEASEIEHFYKSFKVCVFLSEESERVKYFKFKNSYLKIETDLMTDISKEYRFGDIESLSMSKTEMKFTFSGNHLQKGKYILMDVKVDSTGSYTLVARDEKI